MRNSKEQLRNTLPSRVLVVCSSNVCRSPYGEYHLKRLVESSPSLKGRIEVESAAVFNQSRVIFPKTRAILVEEGWSPAEVDAHVPRFKRRCRDSFEKADLIIGMTQSHRWMTPRRFRRKFLTLSEVARGRYIKIPDPFLLPKMEDYQKALSPIKTYCEETTALWENLIDSAT